MQADAAYRCILVVYTADAPLPRRSPKLETKTVDRGTYDHATPELLIVVVSPTHRRRQLSVLLVAIDHYITGKRSSLERLTRSAGW